MDYFSHSWLPYIYLYGVGGIFFFTGVYLVWKTGAIDLNKSHHRTWMRVFFLGYAWFMVVHGLFTYFALQ